MVSKIETNIGAALVDDVDSASQELSCSTDSPTNTNSYRLQHTWSLFYKSNIKNKDNQDWQKNQQLIHQFDSVEEFWRLFNNIRAPKDLPDGELSLCHRDTVLAWEHPRFAAGGRWMVRVPDGYLREMDMPRLDAFWQYLALGAIGEQLGGACGVSVSVRRSYSKVSIWMDSSLCANVESVRTVGRAIARIVALLCTSADDLISIDFAPFETESPLEKLAASVSQRGIEGDFKIETEQSGRKAHYK